MSTRILDLDLAEPLPDTIEIGECDRLLLIFWSRGVPLGTREIRNSSGRIDSLELAAALGRTLGEGEGQGGCPLPVPGTFPLASVVVCTCRRPDELDRCLQALKDQDHPRFEIVVVDNDPGLSAAALVRERYPQCRYVAETRPGVRYARNRGLAEARGEIVAFVDDDCLPVACWLRALAGNFLARPRLGCCTGPVLPAALDTSAQEWLEQRGGFNRGFVRRIHSRLSGIAQCPAWPLQAWMFGSGGNMAFRRSLFTVIGAFDEVLPTAEDIEIFSRVLRAGFELAYEPAAAVRHRHVSDYAALRRRLYLWGWGYIAYLLKVACDDPLYRRRALAEIANWFFPYQVRERLFGQLTRRARDFPLELILVEIAGGLAAIPGYCWLRHRGRRQAAELPASFTEERR